MSEKILNHAQRWDAMPEALLSAMHQVADTILHETDLESAERAARVIGKLGEAVRQYLL